MYILIILIVNKINGILSSRVIVLLFRVTFRGSPPLFWPLPTLHVLSSFGVECGSCVLKRSLSPASVTFLFFLSELGNGGLSLHHDSFFLLSSAYFRVSV